MIGTYTNTKYGHTVKVVKATKAKVVVEKQAGGQLSFSRRLFESWITKGIMKKQEDGACSQSLITSDD